MHHPKCGHLIRALPPDKTADFSRTIDECLVAATQDVFRLEGLEELQKDLLFIPASRGGWGYTSLDNIREIAYIAGTASTPFIPREDTGIPDTGYIVTVTNEIQRAIDSIKGRRNARTPG